jgi:hypothetical protein
VLLKRSLLRSSRCARSTPLPSLRCRRPFTARCTLHARVTPACAFPCPLRRSSRAAAPSRVAACAGPAARVRPARRLSAPAARARTCSRVGRGARAAYAEAAAWRTRARALPRRAGPPIRALACGCGLLTVSSRCSQPCACVFSRAPWWQHPCTSALTTVVVRSQRACGAERSDRTAEASGACALLCADA